MEIKIDNFKQVLKENSLKCTPKRTEVIKLLLKEDRYLNPQEVWKMLKRKFDHLGLPTVYRIMEKFHEIGLLASIKGSDNQFYYFLCSKNNSEHHHFICKTCRKVRCLDICYFNSIKEKIEKKFGCDVENHFLQLEGYCDVCKRSKNE